MTATAPAELVVQALGWRGLFALLGGLSALAALLIVGIVPDESRPSPSPVRPQQTLTLLTIYRDRRFWRLAPLSAIGIGTSWSLQGLWAAPWLKDVDGLDRGSVVAILSVMGIAVSASGLMLGLAANHVRRRGGKTEHVLVATVAVSIAAQLALVFRLPVASSLSWGAIAAAGAATVLSYAILAQYYPREVSGRANAALNLLHVAGAFALQSLMGLILQQWPVDGDRYPAEAHQCAMAVVLGLELAALAWFLLPQQAVRRLAPLARLVTAAASTWRAPRRAEQGAAPAGLQSTPLKDGCALSPGRHPQAPPPRPQSEAGPRARTRAAARRIPPYFCSRIKNGTPWMPMP